MSYIFKLDFRKRAILNKECTGLCPELRKITEKDLLAIILTYDYYSPYHQFPLEERLRKAKRHVYGDDNVNFEKKKIISKAIELYKSLQYDYKRELIETYRSKIFVLQKSLEDTTDNKELGLMLDSISKLGTSIEKMQKEIEKEDDYLEIKGGTKLSLLEKLQQNRELFYQHARINDNRKVSDGKISAKN